MAGRPGDYNWTPEPPYPITGPEKPYWWYIGRRGERLDQGIINAIEAAKPLWGQYRFQEANNMVEAAKRALSPNVNWGNSLQDSPIPSDTVVTNSFSAIQANVNALILLVNSTATDLRAMIKFSYVDDGRGKGQRDSMIKYKIDLAARANQDAYDLYSREIHKQTALMTSLPFSGIPTSGVADKSTQDKVDIGLYGSYVYYFISDTPNTNFPPLPTSCAKPPPPPHIVELPPTGTVMDGGASDTRAAQNRAAQLAAEAALASSTAKTSAPSATLTPPAPPVRGPFRSAASFKAGTNKAANAAGRKALADAAKAAAATSKLRPDQTKQLMNNVAKAIKGNTTSGNLTLGKPKGSSTRGGKPLSRPAGSGNNTVPGRTYITNTPIPTVASWPPGAVSSPSPGCFKDKNGATFCT